MAVLSWAIFLAWALPAGWGLRLLLRRRKWGVFAAYALAALACLLVAAVYRMSAGLLLLVLLDTVMLVHVMDGFEAPGKHGQR